MRFPARPAAALGLAVACHGDSDPRGPTWEDVAPVVEERCARCHFEGGPAGLPLSTWRQVHASRGVVEHVVAERQMPPWPAEQGLYAFANDPTLTDRELAKFARWFDAGAPLGEADPDEPVPVPPPAHLPEVSVAVGLAEPYTPDPAEEDDYRCFVVEPTGVVGPFVRGFEFVADNASLVHHANLKLVYPTDGGAALAAQLELDDAPGFECDSEVDSELGGDVVRLGGWLPGNAPTIFPEASGLPIEEGAVFLMVMHYHPPGSDGGADQSRFDLWTETEVEHPLGTAVLGGSRPGPRGLSIPAGAPHVEYTTGRRTWQLGIPGSGRLRGGAEILSAHLHMHQLGTEMVLEVEQDGQASDLVRIPAWDFDWQVQYWLAEPLALQPKDTLRLTCTYDNSAGTSDVVWGEGTDDEMCMAMFTIR